MAKKLVAEVQEMWEPLNQMQAEKIAEEEMQKAKDKSERHIDRDGLCEVACKYTKCSFRRDRAVYARGDSRD